MNLLLYKVICGANENDLDIVRWIGYKNQKDYVIISPSKITYKGVVVRRNKEKT